MGASNPCCNPLAKPNSCNDLLVASIAFWVVETICSADAWPCPTACAKALLNLTCSLGSPIIKEKNSLPEVFLLLAHFVINSRIPNPNSSFSISAAFWTTNLTCWTLWFLCQITKPKSRIFSRYVDPTTLKNISSNSIVWSILVSLAITDILAGSLISNCDGKNASNFACGTPSFRYSSFSKLTLRTTSAAFSNSLYWSFLADSNASSISSSPADLDPPPKASCNALTWVADKALSAKPAAPASAAPAAKAVAPGINKGLAILTNFIINLLQ